MDNRSVEYLRKAPEKWSPEIPWAGRGRNFQAFELGWDVETILQVLIKIIKCC